ncbi:uncharacterized protein LOC124299013 [Neodiprion virginianus]|uniref:uncharacterized protein LOC124299013 n=1 Tax=Neodiprion virginianus TaxID=2961670 RepID=UPI001EE704FB|nr:uncharacterized protein LOC124299013 [Neodiprion virginianus]
MMMSSVLIRYATIRLFLRPTSLTVHRSIYVQYARQFDEEKTAKLYRNIKKTLQEVQQIASEVNCNYKELEENMNRAARLITAIQICKRPEAEATALTETND